MKKILLICTGNTCRSPMATALLIDRLKKAPETSDWVVASAGTWAYDGYPAVQHAQTAMKMRGLDISQHASRRVTKEILDWADLAVVMEGFHKEALLTEFPEMDGKLFMLTELAGQAGDVEDPIGRSLREYVRAATDIDHLIERSMPSIMGLLA